VSASNPRRPNPDARSTSAFIPRPLFSKKNPCPRPHEIPRLCQIARCARPLFFACARFARLSTRLRFGAAYPRKRSGRLALRASTCVSERFFAPTFLGFFTSGEKGQINIQSFKDHVVILNTISIFNSQIAFPQKKKSDCLFQLNFFGRTSTLK
jgi:hypothetical protein